MRPYIIYTCSRDIDYAFIYSSKWAAITCQDFTAALTRLALAYHMNAYCLVCGWQSFRHYKPISSFIEAHSTRFYKSAYVECCALPSLQAKNARRRMIHYYNDTKANTTEGSWLKASFVAGAMFEARRKVRRWHYQDVDYRLPQYYAIYFTAGRILS